MVKKAKAAAKPAAPRTGARKSAAKKATGPHTKVVSPVEAVVRFIQSLEPAEAADFIKRAEAVKAVVTLRATSVAFVDRFIAKKRAAAAANEGLAANVVDPCPDGKRCFKS
jgi:hypothetical protein